MMKQDPREQPSYTIPEAARYLGIPVSTVRYWSVGRGSYAPLIAIPPCPDLRPTLLSFLNLSELHVLSAIRRDHNVSMPRVRSAIEYLKESITLADPDHPLISYDLETNGLDLFVERYGELINLSRGGQICLRDSMGGALKRIGRDGANVPIKLYPFTRSRVENAPAMIAIEPGLSAGRPVINGTGLVTHIIAERYKAGESIKELMQDYGRLAEEIEEAVRYELDIAA